MPRGGKIRPVAIINVDTTYIIGSNGISRDARNILDQLQSKNDISEIRFLNIPLNKSRFLRKILNLLNLLFNLHFPIGHRYKGVFYQPHISPFMPGRNSTAWVIRLHDMFPITNPEWFRWWANLIFKRNLTFAAKKGANFLFSSMYSQNVFLDLYPECADKVALMPCVATDLTVDLCRNCQGCSEINQNPNQDSTLLAVGTIEPRKNYDLLIEFWQSFGTVVPGIRRLLVIGAPGWKTEKTQNKLSRLKKQRLIWLNNCCDGSLNFFYSNSTYFVSASIDEGFNLPALEARAKYGLPLFLSDISVHREIHGNNAKYFKSSEELLFLISSNLEMSKSTSKIESNSDNSSLQSFFNNMN
jgi:glycosyltransferase involved in cell wall biosynthesis